jgi:hypothetical protein
MSSRNDVGQVCPAVQRSNLGIFVVLAETWPSSMGCQHHQHVRGKVGVLQLLRPILSESVRFAQDDMVLEGDIDRTRYPV